MYPTPEEIKQYIQSGLNCAHITVEGAGLRLIARHQKVYTALGERMKAEIHALSFKTLTPEEFAKQSAS